MFWFWRLGVISVFLRSFFSDPPALHFNSLRIFRCHVRPNKAVVGPRYGMSKENKIFCCMFFKIIPSGKIMQNRLAKSTCNRRHWHAMSKNMNRIRAHLVKIILWPTHGTWYFTLSAKIFYSGAVLVLFWRYIYRYNTVLLFGVSCWQVPLDSPSLFYPTNWLRPVSVFTLDWPYKLRDKNDKLSLSRQTEKHRPTSLSSFTNH